MAESGNHSGGENWDVEGAHSNLDKPDVFDTTSERLKITEWVESDPSLPERP